MLLSMMLLLIVSVSFCGAVYVAGNAVAGGGDTFVVPAGCFCFCCYMLLPPIIVFVLCGCFERDVCRGTRPQNCQLLCRCIGAAELRKLIRY